jgi:HAD superfamily hydrolase (TIGR01509 family)
MTPHPINAVIFDMDGTLHDTESVYVAATKRAVVAVGFEIGDDFLHSMIGIPSRECDVMLQDHFGPDFPFVTYDRHCAAIREDLLLEGVAIKPGALGFLAYLAEMGVPSAIATSAGRHSADEHLHRSGLHSRFPVIVTRDDVERGKPYPDPFLRAAALLGVAPARCIAVEDSFNGIRAAHAAGMMPVMVPDILQPTPEISAMCVLVAADMDEVQAFVAGRLLRGA